MAACDSERLFGPRKKALSMGVSVFPGWANPRPEFGLVPGVQCPQSNPWAGLRTDDRIPAIGQYDERVPSVTLWRLQQMERAGIEWVTYQHEWSPGLASLLMNHCAENHPDDARVQFAFSNWDVLTNSQDGISYYKDWTAADIRESLRKYGQTVQPFTRNASYLRVGDRPVLFRGAVQFLTFYGHWGISPKEVLNLISEAFPERPYWVATGTSEDVYGMLKSWGFDAFTEYLLYGNSWSEVEKTYRDYWASSLTIAKASGLDFWVPASCGYDNRAFLAPQGDQVFMPTSEQFTAHLSEARDFADYHREITRGRVLVYAMNEWCEGGVLEPCAPNALHDGDEMLVAFKAAA
jgi:hypothetical protein